MKLRNVKHTPVCSSPVETYSSAPRYTGVHLTWQITTLRLSHPSGQSGLLSASSALPALCRSESDAVMARRLAGMLSRRV